MTKPPSRWAAVPRFPLTKTIRKAFPLAATKRGIRKPEIVSEQLCGKLCQGLWVETEPGDAILIIHLQTTSSRAFPPTYFEIDPSIFSTSGLALDCGRPKLTIFSVPGVMS